MRVPEHCTADAGMFFDGHPAELALYEALFRRMDGAFPEGTVKVQKSQISFYGRHLFAAASLPVRRIFIHNTDIFFFCIQYALINIPDSNSCWKKTLCLNILSIRVHKTRNFHCSHQLSIFCLYF